MGHGLLKLLFYSLFYPYSPDHNNTVNESHWSGPIHVTKAERKVGKCLHASDHMSHQKLGRGSTDLGGIINNP